MLVWNKPKTGLNTQFVQALEDVIGPLLDAFYVTQAFRTYTDQAAKYEKYLAGGPKAAPPGFSPHEYGLAVDVALDEDAVRTGLQPNWDLKDDRWKNLIFVVQRSALLHSGVGFGDGDHIEMVNWKAYK